MKPQSTTALLLPLGVLWASVGNAQLTALNSNVSAGFAMTGFIQAATLNPGGAANAGGTLTINNITMIVPDNSVIQMPANALTWAQLFDVKLSTPIFDNSIPAQSTPPINHPANNSLGLPMTGLALSDAPATPPAAGTFPGFFPSSEVTVIGNIGTAGISRQSTLHCGPDPSHFARDRQHRCGIHHCDRLSQGPFRSERHAQCAQHRHRR